VLFRFGAAPIEGVGAAGTGALAGGTGGATAGVGLALTSTRVGGASVWALVGAGGAVAQPWTTRATSVAVAAARRGVVIAARLRPAEAP